MVVEERAPIEKEAREKALGLNPLLDPPFLSYLLQGLDLVEREVYLLLRYQLPGYRVHSPYEAVGLRAGGIEDYEPRPVQYIELSDPAPPSAPSRPPTIKEMEIIKR
jgi:hypothetical protein